MVGRRGFTTIEALVVCSIVLSLLAGLYMFLQATFRYSRETEAYAYAQREATVIVKVLSAELGNSIDRWVEYGPSPGAYIRFLSARAADGTVRFEPSTGKLVWQRWVCYYHDPTTRTLVRSEVPLSPPTHDLNSQPLPSPIDLAAFKAVASESRRIVGRAVEDFLVDGGPTTYDFRVVTAYQAAVATGTDQRKTARVSLDSRVTLLNRWP